MRINPNEVVPVRDGLIVAFRAHGGKAGLVFTSKHEAARILKMTGSMVNDVVRGRRRHAKGWVFARVVLDVPVLTEHYGGTD